MTRRRRNFVLRLLGIGLTLGVVGLDAIGVLSPIERWMYDKRAALFQHFSPKPTDELAHVDIDDSALEAIGAWPWSRSTLAGIIDELSAAGAKAVALDVLFAESQPDHDAQFAESIRRSGNVLIPASFTLDPLPIPSPAQQQAVAMLTKDLEATLESVSADVRARNLELPEREFLAAREEAALRRAVIERRNGCVTLAGLRDRLLPPTHLAGSSLDRQLEIIWNKLEVEQTLSRFSRPRPRLAQPTAKATGAQPLVPQLAAAATFGGYVDLLQPSQDGGVVRTVPLWVEKDGRLYPQMALSLACAAMGTDPSAITLLDNGMIIPRPGGPDLFVPLRMLQSEKQGQIGMFFDIPWFGENEWETMYDVPDHKRFSQHVPVTIVWAVAEGRRKVAWNNRQADEALKFFAGEDLDAKAAKKFLAAPTPPDEFAKRRAAIVETLADLDALGGLSAYEGVKAEELKPQERDFINSYKALANVRDKNDDTLRTLTRKITELREAVRGKSILIGWTATSATDNYTTSLHQHCPGVVVHGAIFNALMTGDFLRAAPFWVNALITLTFGLLTTMIVGWLEPWKALMLSLTLVLSYLGFNGATLFDYFNWIVGAAGPTVAGMTVWSGLTLSRFISEAKEKSRITRRFGTYADPNLVRFIIDHPELNFMEGRVEELTVVFTDLAGFTTLTERLREKAVPILSEYMSRMVPVIQQNGGLVNKFLGDGIMFFYGAPRPNADHATAAVRTVMQMNPVLEQFNRELTAKGYPNVSMRAGISTGPMVVGDAGSQARSDYTVLGDAVNLGARLESANKAVGTKIMLSGRTAELLNNQFLVRPIGKLRVAGKTEGIMTFEPLAATSEATPEQHELVRMSAEIFDAYVAARFTHCLSAADRFEGKFGASKLTATYRELSTEYLATPPETFDGVITLKEK